MLYIHIPYCKGKCIYCDFYSTGNLQQSEYIEALFNELSSREEELGECLSSIYMGGGTPSLLSRPSFLHLTQKIKEGLDKRGGKLSPDLEFTVEVNPEDVTKEMIKTWKEAGVNRLSVGIQSFSDKDLKFLHRRHSADKAREACGLIAENFNNYSFDLIYAIPGQTLEGLRDNVVQALDFNPKHISIYGLTYEEHTPLEILRQRGDIVASDEDIYIELDNLVASLLTEAGYERYEISNYALKGFHSRHNSGYWAGIPYVGLGPGASSFDGGRVRRFNPTDLKGYLNHFSQPSTTAFYKEETLSDEERREEVIMVSLRTSKGIDLQQFSERFGKESKLELLDKAQSFLKSSKLKLEDDHLRLSSEGIQISDLIILSLS